MAATSTLGQIIIQLAEETGIGYVIPSYTGTTTTLTNRPTIMAALLDRARVRGPRPANWVRDL